MNKVTYFEIPADDMQQSQDFYSKVFGWQYTDHEMPDTIYTVIQLHGKDIGGIWAIPKDKQDTIQPHWVTYILVDDIDEYVQKAEDNGAKIIMHSTQAGDFGKFAIIEDPVGAHIAFWEPSKKG